jgi:hypothetical protein
LKLPNLPQALIPRAKVVDYLLSPSHPYGRHKAAFFYSFGFAPDSVDQLTGALLEHADQNEVATVERTAFGTRYTIEGSLNAPDGRAPSMRVVWFVRNSEESPRLATAYPVRRIAR